MRTSTKQHGMQRRIEGPDVAGRAVLAVEDTSTTGASVLTAVAALREAELTSSAWPPWWTATPEPARPSKPPACAYRAVLTVSELW